MTKGNGELKRLAKRMDDRFGRLERELEKGLKALRKDTRSLFDYVVFLDKEFQAHRHDRIRHFAR